MDETSSWDIPRIPTHDRVRAIRCINCWAKEVEGYLRIYDHLDNDKPRDIVAEKRLLRQLDWAVECPIKHNLKALARSKTDDLGELSQGIRDLSTKLETAKNKANVDSFSTEPGKDGLSAAPPSSTEPGKGDLNAASPSSTKPGKDGLSAASSSSTEPRKSIPTQSAGEMLFVLHVKQELAGRDFSKLREATASGKDELAKKLTLDPASLCDCEFDTMTQLRKAMEKVTKVFCDNMYKPEEIDLRGKEAEGGNGKKEEEEKESHYALAPNVVVICFHCGVTGATRPPSKYGKKQLEDIWKSQVPEDHRLSQYCKSRQRSLTNMTGTKGLTKKLTWLSHERNAPPPTFSFRGHLAQAYNSSWEPISPCLTCRALRNYSELVATVPIEKAHDWRCCGEHPLSCRCDKATSKLPHPGGIATAEGFAEYLCRLSQSPLLPPPKDTATGLPGFVLDSI